MRRAVEEVAVGPEDVLRAVAVMDVEIDDRDALGIIAGARIVRGDRHIVEEAEAHGAARFGMMAGRARWRRRHCPPRRLNTASTPAIPRRRRRARPLRASPATSRCRDRAAPIAGRDRGRSARIERIYASAMGAGDVVVLAERRFLAVEVGENRMRQQPVDDAQGDRRARDGRAASHVRGRQDG